MIESYVLLVLKPSAMITSTINQLILLAYFLNSGILTRYKDIRQSKTIVNRFIFLTKKSGGARIAKQQKQSGNQARINRDIRIREARVIDADGNQLGIISIQEALAAAEEVGLDLVEISPNADPPVCKIMDYGRFKYEQTKKLQEAKKKQTTFQVKEIKVRPKTDTHDLEIKIGRIEKFIAKKDKVKVTVVFRGREITLTQKGRELLTKIAEDTKEYAVVEQSSRMEGRIMHMILAPK
jgi:translation initiation factor IF-3